MYYYLIAPISVVRKDETAFTYHHVNPLAIGTVVRIPVGKKLITGIITGLTKKPPFTTKAIDQVINAQPIPKSLLELAYWMSDYYATHLGLVLQTILPSGIHKKRRSLTKVTNHPSRNRTKIVLSKEQTRALLIADKYKTGTLLLHGVTGSGKTQLYIEAAKHEQRQGRSSIILVPEIALTPQLVAEFTNHFNKVIVVHSGLRETERHQAWLEALNATEPTIVIGPRSAIFTPLANVGLIVIDECHEPTYKQEQSPRYSTLRVASVLARFHKAKAILGSATPTVSDYYLAKSTKSPILRLTTPAVKVDNPQVQLIDLKRRDDFREHYFLSDALLHAIRQTLAQKQQILLFHNRRGTAPTTLCQHCGWSALCKNCHVTLTLHADKHKLVCHLCNQQQPVPPYCPECHHAEIVFRGLGTKRIEEEVRKLFPKASIARFDADNHHTETIQARYQQLYDGDIDIIIGTQLIAKGLDLPNLQVVGILQADSGLQIPDYQAEERVFQLLYQAAGRVGRTKSNNQIILQTYQPDHRVIQQAIARDYAAFYEQQIRERHTTDFPPFRYLLKLTCSYKTEQGAIRAAKQTASRIAQDWPAVTILGPTPAFYERLGGAFRWQLIIKSKKRSELLNIAQSMPSSWFVDIDPGSLL
jgi:primosomal protein N' (replication factor Y)